MNKTLLATALVVMGGAALFAGDVFRFRGENSQGMYMEEKGLLKTWPQEGLTPKWTYTGLGEGWSSPVKVGNRLYVTGTGAGQGGQAAPQAQGGFGGGQGRGGRGQRGAQQGQGGSRKEYVICLDLDGKEIWRTATGTPWERSYPGARSTPTYVPGEKEGEGRLVVTTGSGELFCLNAADGKILWQKNIANDYGSKFGMWAMAECPVVKDGVVFVTAGGSKALVVALKVADGSEVWTAKSNGDTLAYVTPVIVKDQLIVMTGSKVNGVNIKDGTVMWENDYAKTVSLSGMGGVNCNSPTVEDNRFFVSAGYDAGGVLYELKEDGKGVNVIWTNKKLDPHHDCTVLIDGKLYGSNWTSNNSGNWMCVDWESGETLYEVPWSNLGKGNVIYADGLIYMYEEKRGTIAIAKPGEKLDVVSSFQIKFGDKEHWAHPVICDGIMYVRHGNVLGAFDIKAK
ncbi:MAG: PQQ-like beta-propeller repeat protein [Lentisphaeria bacterium]|nr:PQQ-like beta-propeller repeat protein [Lentisphaeria bacterium]